MPLPRYYHQTTHRSDSFRGDIFGFIVIGTVRYLFDPIVNWPDLRSDFGLFHCSLSIDTQGWIRFLLAFKGVRSNLDEKMSNSSLILPVSHDSLCRFGKLQSLSRLLI